MDRTSALDDLACDVKADRLRLLQLACELLFEGFQELEEGVLLIRNILLLLQGLDLGFAVLFKDNRNHIGGSELGERVLHFLLVELLHALLEGVFLLERLDLLHAINYYGTHYYNLGNLPQQL